MTTNSLGPVPASGIPNLTPDDSAAPTMPGAFVCRALLHPFAPPPPVPNLYSPFYQLCSATIWFSEGEFLVVLLAGREYGVWMYEITAAGTRVYSDQNPNWTEVDMGWTLPTTDWFCGATANSAGQSPINWMEAQTASWWKSVVPGSSNNAPGATWWWYHEFEGFQVPLRCMFGVQPPEPEKGDPRQLAVFQNFSFTYFDAFEVVDVLEMPEPSDYGLENLNPGGIQGLQWDNPNNYPNFVWPESMAVTAFMTPVNETYNPLPTRVIYRWDNEAAFQSGGARGQNTLMNYDYPNADNYTFQLALLTRQPPDNRPLGYDAMYGPGGQLIPSSVVTGTKFWYGTEPPNWVSVGQGTIQATITNNATWCPNETVTVYGVMFPPAKNYPQGTYLWTWYVPQGGVMARPVVFMQSASALGVGTSLALADYFYYSDSFNKDDYTSMVEPPVPDQASF